MQMQNTKAVLQAMPILCPLGIAICSASVILNVWIFLVLRNLRTASSSGADSDSGRVYNLTLIRHLLITDIITAVLVVMDLVLKAQSVQHLTPTLPQPPQHFLNHSFSNDSIDLPLLPPLPALSPLPFPGLNWPYNGSSKPMPGYSCLGYITKHCLHTSHALTLLALTLIAIDLYIFVIRALSYRRAFIVRYLTRLLLASWSTCLALTALPIAFHAAVTASLPSKNWRSKNPRLQLYCRFEPDPMGRFCCVGQLDLDFNSLQILLAVFVISCCAVTFCYSRIVITICRLAASAPGAAPTSIAAAARQNVRGVATSVGLLLVFYALFLPYFFILLGTNMMSDARNMDGVADAFMTNEHLGEYMEVVMATYTLFNPLVYACRLRAVRRRSSRTLAVLGRRRTRDSAAQYLVLGSDNLAATLTANNSLPTARSPYTSLARSGPLGSLSARGKYRQSLQQHPSPTKPLQQQADESIEQYELQQL